MTQPPNLTVSGLLGPKNRVSGLLGQKKKAKIATRKLKRCGLCWQTAQERKFTRGHLKSVIIYRRIPNTLKYNVYPIDERETM